MIPIARSLAEADNLFDQGHNRIMCVIETDTPNYREKVCTTPAEAREFFQAS